MVSSPLDPQDIERLRDLTFRRLPDLRLSTVDAVRRFVNRVGFAFLYRVRGSELPSVWGAIAARRNPTLPRHIQRHAGVALAWEAKDVLAARRRIHYGKVLRRAPTFVSLELFPAFYALTGNRGEASDLERWARSGLLTPGARAILWALLHDAPLTTLELQARTGLSGRSRRTDFQRGMAELEERMLVVKYAEIYHPRFTFLWGPLHSFLPDAVARARALDPDAARDAILERYLAVRFAARTVEIERLFGWPRRDVEEALGRLHDRGRAVLRRLGNAGPQVHAIAGIERALSRLGEGWMPARRAR